MSDPKSSNLWHVILTPADLQAIGSVRNLEQSLLDGLPLDVCHLEPIDAARASELTELFAKMSADESGPCHAGSADGPPCPICSPPQQDLVAEAIRRALRR